MIIKSFFPNSNGELKIEQLSKINYFDRLFNEVANLIRILGNSAMHENISFLKEDAEDVLESTIILSEILFVLNKKVEKLNAIRNKIKN